VSRQQTDIASELHEAAQRERGSDPAGGNQVSGICTMEAQEPHGSMLEVKQVAAIPPERC
jgi:hypothetical protein